MDIFKTLKMPQYQEISFEIKVTISFLPNQDSGTFLYASLEHQEQIPPFALSYQKSDL